ncbi:MAG: lysophospholipid acyltransferase family protein [Candidatus Binatia bacterium]|nr:lysophospholipid acyltransferase family protein [Candidatus Binatia bacterium]
MRLLPAGSRRERAFVWMGGLLIFLVLQFLRWTTRSSFEGEEELFSRFASEEPVILAFWHGRLAMMPFAYRGRGACIMNSRHRDGALVSRAIERLGIEVVHGSSTRGWVGGLKGLLAAHERGLDIVVVPDGPKGPRCKAKPGILQLARATGAPIYPVGYSATSFGFLSRSWDRLLLPKPLSHVHYVAGDCVRVPAAASAAEMEEARRLLEARLVGVAARADELAGIPAALSAEWLATAPAPSAGSKG